MYGMLFSIKSFVNKISPIDPKEGFLYYKTNKYALHYLETPSGLKYDIQIHCCNFFNTRMCFFYQTSRFVINTDPAAMDVKKVLQDYYAKVWVEYVVQNPLWIPGTPVTSELFKLKTDEFIKQLPLFGIKNI